MELPTKATMAVDPSTTYVRQSMMDKGLSTTDTGLSTADIGPCTTCVAPLANTV